MGEFPETLGTYLTLPWDSRGREVRGMLARTSVAIAIGDWSDGSGVF